MFYFCISFFHFFVDLKNQKKKVSIQDDEKEDEEKILIK